MKNKMYVKIISFTYQKWGLFLILILVILCHKSLWLTPLDTKKVPQKRPLIKTHISCCQYWARSYPYLYTSIWSHVIRKKVRKRRKSQRKRGRERSRWEKEIKERQVTCLSSFGSIVLWAKCILSDMVPHRKREEGVSWERSGHGVNFFPVQRQSLEDRGLPLVR